MQTLPIDLPQLREHQQQLTRQGRQLAKLPTAYGQFKPSSMQIEHQVVEDKGFKCGVLRIWVEICVSRNVHYVNRSGCGPDFGP